MSDAIPQSLIEIVRRRLSENKRVRRSLPEWGRIHIDRQLPFLCVYRRPVRETDAGTNRLATSEASYLIGSGQRRLHTSLSSLVRNVVEVLSGQFGACLLLEFWSASAPLQAEPITTASLIPRFRVLATRGASSPALTEEFQEALLRVKLGARQAVVQTTEATKSCPKSLPPLLSTDDARQLGCLVYGLEITPIYRDANGELFPDVLRQLHRGLTIALRRTFFEFARRHTTDRPAHYHSLGRRAVVKAVWEVDRMLAEACSQFDFLLQLTPVNGEQAWFDFRRAQFDQVPIFHYRPLPAEPFVLKRNLYRAPVEQVEDPALAHVFGEKIAEVDRQITMLQDRNTASFLHESMQLYGGVDDDLLALAVRILEEVPSRSRDDSTKNLLSAEQLAQRAREEIAQLRQQDPTLRAKVEIREDVTGLLVSEGNLLISVHTRIPPSRVEPLLQHEVGTHVLTYHNGRTQPFRQLYTGLAGYDALQEGLAVLSEYLVGGLSRPRLRLLAARVIAVRRLEEGASFIDTFRELDRHYDFARRVAFMITMRAYRGGGFTKDAVYLQGLCQILEYLGKGGELRPLLVGKFAIRHIPIVRELMWRKVLRDPPLIPRYLDRPEAQTRLQQLRGGMTVLDLIQRSNK